MILDKTRPRRTVARRILLVALIPSTAALVTLAILRPDARAQTASTAQLPEPQITYFPLSDQRKKLRIAQAHQLREHLTGWADTNKTAILQMQQAKSNDLTAMMPIYRSLVEQPLPLWKADPRVAEGNEMPGFSTQTTGLTLSHLQHSKEPICQGIRQDFATYRDIRISRSIDPGNVCIVVWASGRITEATVSSKFIGHGKPFLQIESQKALIPGFFPTMDDKKIGERMRYSIAE